METGARSATTPQRMCLRSGLVVALILLAGMLGPQGAGAAGVEGCAEPDIVALEFATVGTPFAFDAGLGCVPGGDQLSQPAIEWGDGTASAPAEVGMYDGVPSWVAGEHVYAEPGSYLPWVSVSDLTTGRTLHLGWHTAVDVSEAPAGRPLFVANPTPAPASTAPTTHAEPAPAVQARGATVTARVDRRSRPIVAELYADVSPAALTATIAWGDGSVGHGTVVGSAPALRVIGRHRWSRRGRYTITVTVSSAGGEVLAHTLGHAHVHGAG
jgi:hypothetical protein